MDKQTLSNYGWIVIAVLVLSVMIALATPFGTYIENGVKSTTAGLFDTSEKALNVVGMSAGNGSFDGGSGESQVPNEPINNGLRFNAEYRSVRALTDDYGHTSEFVVVFYENGSSDITEIPTDGRQGQTQNCPAGWFTFTEDSILFTENPDVKFAEITNNGKTVKIPNFSGSSQTLELNLVQ